MIDVGGKNKEFFYLSIKKKRESPPGIMVTRKPKGLQEYG